MASSEHPPLALQPGHHPLQECHAHRLRLGAPTMEIDTHPAGHHFDRHRIRQRLDCGLNQPRLRPETQKELARIDTRRTHGGKESPTDSVAQQRFVAVAPIVPPLDAERTQPLFKALFVASEQRTPQLQGTDIGRGGDTATTGNAAALQQTHGHRLGGIAALMAQGKGG